MANATLTSRIALLGVGEVGSTIAYSLILNPVAGHILLVDPKTEVRDAQVQDLLEATYHGNTSTWGSRWHSQGGWLVWHRGHHGRCETEEGREPHGPD
jgi:hypothetical protein